jgi:hypothetical protein
MEAKPKTEFRIKCEAIADGIIAQYSTMLAHGDESDKRNVLCLAVADGIALGLKEGEKAALEAIEAYGKRLRGEA